MKSRLPLTFAASSLALAAAVVPALLIPSAASADTDDFTFASYDADYYLSRADDGSSRLTTVETLIAEFPDTDQNKGIIRAIPLGFKGADPGVSVESVTDGNGTAVPFEESDDEGFREVSIGTDDYVRGEQTYVITYDQRNVVDAYDDTDADEFYWDLNGVGWNQPFGSVTGRVHVGTDLATKFTGSTACYVGGQGSTDRCAVKEGTDADGAVFTVSADRIGAEETVSIAIGFDRGTFAEPTRTKDEPWVAIVPGVVAVLAAVLAAIAGLLRRLRWRDARGRGTIVAQYERPAGIDLLESGELTGRTAKAMSAGLIDLAVRGNLRIIDRTPADHDTDRKYSLEFRSFDGLTEPERKVMRAVFGRDPDPGDRKKIGSSVEVGRRLQVQAKNVTDRVIEKGWMRAVPGPQRVIVFSAAIAVAVIAFVVFMIIVIADGLTWPGTLLLLAAVGFVVLALVAAAKRSSLTDAGAELRDHLDGIRDYVRLAEADRFRMLQSPEGAERRAVDTFDPTQVVRIHERLLPFAVLYGMEKEWAEELERLWGATDASPDWYVGTRPFNGGFVTGFLVSSSAQASASVWSSSGTGSGFGGSTGGGFAGGGGGGGGGGGR